MSKQTDVCVPSGTGPGSATAHRVPEGCIAMVYTVWKFADPRIPYTDVTFISGILDEKNSWFMFCLFICLLTTPAVLCLIHIRFVGTFWFLFCHTTHHSHLLRSACLFCLSQSPKRYGFFCLLLLFCFSLLFFSLDGGSPVVALLGAFVVVL